MKYLRSIRGVVVLGACLLALVRGLIGAGLILASSLAFGTQPTPASGLLTVTSAQVVGFEMNGGNQVLTIAQRVVVTGTITGEVDEVIHAVIHADGTGVYQTDGTFTGTIDGRSGSIEIKNKGTIAPTPYGIPLASGQVESTGRGTDNFQDLHVALDVSNLVFVGGSYTGSYHFD